MAGRQRPKARPRDAQRLRRDGQQPARDVLVVALRKAILGRIEADPCCADLLRPGLGKIVHRAVRHFAEANGIPVEDE